MRIYQWTLCCQHFTVDHCLIFEIDADDNTKRSKILKLHKQFGHASSNNLKNLLNAGLLTTEISKVVDEISKNCVICKTHKKPSPRPDVSLLRATKFNQTVAIDLHSLDKNIWYYHKIDEFTRFSNATIIKSKHPEIIIKNFLQNWVSLFGTTFKVFKDNGGEFFSRDFIDFCENFNIKVSTTPAESPWLNGICERHNAILTDIILKVKEDINCSWETALAWALNVKNSFINVSGFSP